MKGGPLAGSGVFNCPSDTCAARYYDAKPTALEQFPGVPIFVCTHGCKGVFNMKTGARLYPGAQRERASHGKGKEHHRGR